MRKLVATAAAVAVMLGSSLAYAGCGTCDKTVVEAAKASKTFETLVAAVGAAGLADALGGEGPFTVFAPTDEAFEKLPAGTVDSLLKPENKEKLQKILKDHVVSGKVKAAQVTKMDEAEALSGAELDIEVDGGTVTVEGAKVVKTDIPCKNGVIHVIDSVILTN